MFQNIFSKKSSLSQSIAFIDEDTKMGKKSKMKKGSCGFFEILCCICLSGCGYNCGSKLCPCCGFNRTGECGADCNDCGDCSRCCGDCGDCSRCCGDCNDCSNCCDCDDQCDRCCSNCNLCFC
jgi:hypothetical protein